MGARAQYFSTTRFGDKNTRSALRQAVLDTYTSNTIISILESKRELTDYVDQRTACCYAFADFIYNLTHDPETDLVAELSIGQPVGSAEIKGTVSYNGVDVEGDFAWTNPSEIANASTETYEASFVPSDTFRYAPTTIVFEKVSEDDAVIKVVSKVEETDPDDPDNPDDPDDPDDPANPEDSGTNAYYEVFSSSTSTIVPGVTQTIKYANTADDKQLVYYIATADVSRDDVSVYANYNNNDGTSWGLQTVRSQMAAAKTNHSDESSDRYIENYTPVVGVNADFFNMNTGEPGGALVMEGVSYHPAKSENFFAILKDGTPLIGSASDWDAHADQIQEAVGGSIWLVKNGEIAVAASTNYYNNRASRTCVGITADGKVVLMVLDGRQEPFSAGGSAQEIAQIMFDAGCVQAINLDGGGSSTFVAKQEGSDEPIVVNRPSDGYERKVSSSLMVVSTAPASNSFDHAALSAESEYVGVGGSVQISALGVSASGGSADLPQNTQWAVDNADIATIDENGMLSVVGEGDVTVSLCSDNQAIGTIVIHAVIPDALSFEKSEITSVYESTIPMPLIATYNGNRVLLNDSTSLVAFDAEKPAIGSFEGLSFTAADEQCGIRSSKVVAYLSTNADVSADATIYMYKSGEAVFDFNNSTAGDRTLAWNREVSNSTLDENVYTIVDPHQPMDVSYVFALDMNSLAIPDNIKAALPIVAQFMGGTDASDAATAWDFLLILAERVSPSTTVTVNVAIDPNLNLDISDILVNCDYFELSSAVIDEESNVLTLTCNWIDVDGPIDRGSANPICIVSGIKATPADDAAWDANDQLAITNSGEIAYNARLRSSQAYSISGSPIGARFGLSQYDNSANLAGDKGAQFSSTHATFEDSFVLDQTDLEGWVTGEEGSLFYYVNNQKLTGIQLVPEPDGEDEYYYLFNEDGVCEGKCNGLVESDGDLYYAVNGVLHSGWRVIGDDYYYFDPETYKAVDGDQTIYSEAKGRNFKYEFVDCKLVDGQWVGKRKAWAGQYITSEWKTIKGKRYYFNQYGFAETGLVAVQLQGSENYGLYIFGDDRALIERVLGDGPLEHDGNLYYLIGGQTGYLGLVAEYYDANGNMISVQEGDAVPPEGTVKTIYYYVQSHGFLLARDETISITKTNGLLPAGRYYFDENGQYIVEHKNGIIKEGDEYYYYVNGEKTYAGLVATYYSATGEVLPSADGAARVSYRYFTSRTFEAVRGKSYYVTKTNDLLPKGTYPFDENGEYVVELAKSGVVKEGDEYYYYVDGKKSYAGLVATYYDASGAELPSADGAARVSYRYFTSRTFEAVRGKSYYVTKTNDLLPKGTYAFDENGEYVVDMAKSGIVEEGGELYYYVDGKKAYAGLVLVDGDYYYYFTSRTFEAVRGKSHYVTKTNGLLPQGTYAFGEDGRMVR